MKTDWQTFEDVRRSAPQDDFRCEPDAETDTCVSANVGDLMETAIAMAGQCVLRLGGRTACETDYLAARGARFPASITYEQMVAFNRRTMKPVMEETDEMARYAAIAGFWRRNHV